MARVVKLGIKRPVTRPLLPDPEPREVKYTLVSVDDHLYGDGTWPDTQRVMENVLGDLPVDEIRAITHENASKLYRHPLPEIVLP